MPVDRSIDKRRETADVDRMAKRMGKYTLVVATAQRARDLRERSSRALVPSAGSFITRALTELGQGSVKVVRKRED